MSDAQFAQLGRAVLELTTDQGPLDDGIKKAKKAADSLEKKFLKVAKSMERIGKSMTTFVTLPILGIGAAMVKVASDAEETRSKFRTVFKDQSAAVGAWADTYADSVNRGRVETLGFLATVQDLFVPLGATREAAAEFSKQVVSLSTDLGSFNNLPTADVLRDIQSTLVGNHETTRKYGVIIDQVTLNQELLNMGIADGAKNATALEKAQARLNMIIAGTADAQGDAERTVGSFANQLKGLKSKVGDLAEAFGTLLLPELSKVVEGASDMAKRFTDLDDSQKKLILRLAVFTAAVGPATLAIGKLIKAVSLLAAHPIVAGLAALALIIGLIINKYRLAKISQDALNEARREALELAEQERRANAEAFAATGVLRIMAAEIEKLKERRRLRAEELGNLAKLRPGKEELLAIESKIADLQLDMAEKAGTAALADVENARRRKEWLLEIIELQDELSLTDRSRILALEHEIKMLEAVGAAMREARAPGGGVEAMAALAFTAEEWAANIGDADQQMHNWGRTAEETIDEISDGMDEIIAQYEQWGSVITSAVVPALELVGEQIATGAVEWETFAQAGNSAIASVIRAFAQQWAFQAAAALAVGNIPSAVGLGAAAAGAHIAAGAIEAGILQSFAGGGFVPSPTLAVVGDTPGGEFVLNQGQMAGLLGGRGGGRPVVVQNVYGHIWQDRSLRKLSRSATSRAPY